MISIEEIKELKHIESKLTSIRTLGKLESGKEFYVINIRTHKRYMIKITKINGYSYRIKMINEEEKEKETKIPIKIKKDFTTYICFDSVFLFRYRYNKEELIVTTPTEFEFYEA